VSTERTRTPKMTKVSQFNKLLIPLAFLIVVSDGVAERDLFTPLFTPFCVSLG
jgi:hypothetical protein